MILVKIFFANCLFFVSDWPICSFAHLSWGTWANRICHEWPEQFAHSRSFVLRDLSESLTVAYLIWGRDLSKWANEWWENEPLSEWANSQPCKGATVSHESKMAAQPCGQNGVCTVGLKYKMAVHSHSQHGGCLSHKLKWWSNHLGNMES